MRYFEVGATVDDGGVICDVVELIACKSLDAGELEDRLRSRGSDVNYVQELSAAEYGACGAQHVTAGVA